MAHPNSLANLRPWKPGQAPPPPGPKKVEQALKIAQQSCPKAAKLIARCISDPELPISTRLRCAEFMLDKALPNVKSGISGILEGNGLEFLELRFVAPGQAKDTPSLNDQAISTTYSVDADISHTSSHTDVEHEDDASC